MADELPTIRLPVVVASPKRFVSLVGILMVNPVLVEVVTVKVVFTPEVEVVIVSRTDPVEVLMEVVVFQREALLMDPVRPLILDTPPEVPQSEVEVATSPPTRCIQYGPAGWLRR